MQWKLRLCIQVQIIFLLDYNVCIHGKRGNEYSVDVGKLASLTQGTELVVLENALHNQKTYRLEDFFWTGSGDGSDETTEHNWAQSTIYSTKTIMSTVYVTPTAYANQTPTITPCIIDCEPITHPTNINPTPTFPPDDEDDEELDADRQFWLLTVLKSDGKDPDINELKRSLANLYRKAFLRQQAQHLGINAKTKRETKPEKPINVYIHKMKKDPLNGNEKIEVVYHVAVSGQPIDAVTAAADMKLVTDEEVKEELGYPFLIKAEPYLKPAKSEELAREKPMWLFIGISIAVIMLLLLAIIFLTMCISKRNGAMGTENRQQVFDQSGQDNPAFNVDNDKRYKSGRRNQNPSPTYINFRSHPSNQTLISTRPQSAMSSTSSSSGSIDISPLMGLGKQRSSAKKHPRPKAAINKTTPLGLNRHSILSVVSTDSSSLENSPNTIFIGNYDPGVVSPKSYLSMPSIKSFPRSNNPEPLNKVLEPVSVLHLDMMDDAYNEQQPREVDYKLFARHGSVGATEDPGIIGPVVWNMHRHRLQHGVSVDEGMDEIKLSSNVSKMRKRFHELLDDTFSLFGSRRESPTKDLCNVPIEVKGHLGTEQNKSVDIQKIRPKTSEPKRDFKTTCEARKGAWTSKAPSPLVRPISAPFIRPNTAAPKIDVDQVLTDSTLPQNDPAIPLIAAIKKEIGKCSLPGSTTNIHE